MSKLHVVRTGVVGRAPRIYCTSSPGSNDRTAQEGNLSVSHIEFSYAG